MNEQVTTGYSRRVFSRDTQHRFLGGVCAGIARYLGWDLILVRLLFIASAVAVRQSGSSPLEPSLVTVGRVDGDRPFSSTKCCANWDSLTISSLQFKH